MVVREKIKGGRDTRDNKDSSCLQQLIQNQLDANRNLAVFPAGAHNYRWIRRRNQNMQENRQ